MKLAFVAWIGAILFLSTEGCRRNDPGEFDSLVYLIEHGSTENEMKRLRDGLKRYPDRVDEIVRRIATALNNPRAMDDPHTSVSRNLGLITLLLDYPEKALPVLEGLPESEDLLTRASIKTVIDEIKGKLHRVPTSPVPAATASLAVNAPLPSTTSAPDWTALSAQAQASADVWEKRGYRLYSQYLNMFAHSPPNVFLPSSSSKDLARAVSDEERFQVWDKRGRDWKACCLELEQRLKMGQ